MLDAIFDRHARRDRDDNEAAYMRERYGSEARQVAARRAQDSSLDRRSRRHWKRVERLL